MTKPQDIIDLIDVGLQTPAPDPTYGEVSPANRESCARCLRPPADDSDWCEGCRAFLLGDRDDPREAGRPGGWEQAPRQIDHLCGDPRCVNPDHLERNPDRIFSRFVTHFHVSALEQSAPPTTAEITAGAELIDIGARPWSDLPPGSAPTYGTLLPPAILSALDDVFERLEALDPAFWPSLEDVAEEPERPVDPDRRRHGHAAICPRHGETRGGTCRRCR